MRPTSQEQFAAARGGELPAVETIREGVWSIPVPNPGGRGPAYTLCYAIEDGSGDVHLVDPGWPDAEMTALRRGLRAGGHALENVATVTVTHAHPDHSGAVDAVRELSGARAVMFADEAETSADFRRMLGGYDPASQLREWGAPEAVSEAFSTAPPPAADLPQLVADIVVTDGELLPIPGRAVRVLHTPGHTAGHQALVLDAERLVLTGDHLLPLTHPGIGLGGSDERPFERYLLALRATAVLDGFEAAPGHEFRFSEIADRCASTAEHHLRRSRETAGILESNPDATVWQIASQLTWTQGFAALSGFVLYSALAQTRMHRDFVRSPAGRVAIGDAWWAGAPTTQEHDNAV